MSIATANKSRKVLVIDDMESIHADCAKALASTGPHVLDALEHDLFGPDETQSKTDDVTFQLDFAAQGLDHPDQREMTPVDATAARRRLNRLVG